MKNRIIVTMILVQVGLLFQACDNRLDVDPNDTVDSENAIQTSADVESLLVGAYNALGDGDVLGGNVQRDAELMGDNGEVYWDGTFVDPEQIWRKEMLTTNDQARQTWLDTYVAINIANTVLEYVDLVTEDRIERVEGEAKFVRALAYFELVRVYAKAWNDGDPAENPGVPLILEPTTLLNVNEMATRNTVAEVYGQIITDLTEAVDLLPEVNGFFATKYSAHAILSRVYLMQGNYAEARNNANLVIESGEFSLEDKFADAFNKTSRATGDRESNTNASVEDIYAIQITSQDGVNNLNTFFGSADFGGRGDILIEPAHFALYEPEDERALMFYDDTYTTKWNNIAGNVNIVRLAEMYLTRAEANFRLGTTLGATALEDINVIRERAGLLPAASITLNDILLQRRLELAFEGHEVHDRKRTQRDIGDKPFDDPNLVFPIPQRERIINPGLDQNDGYPNN